jgi:TDG/mug DNA glycosylase family protein
VGCGGGRYINDLGIPVVGLDAAWAMLDLCRQTWSRSSQPLLVQGDLEALPFGHRTVSGAWANMSYLHVPRVRLPMALFDLHRILAAEAPVDLQVLAGDHEGDDLPDDDIGGRFFAAWQPEALVDVLTGAGFESARAVRQDDVVRATACRARTLADTVGPGMRLLIAGLNPSLYAADAGVGFARPGNRFWPAALSSGIVSRDRDPLHALRAHGVGMTDLVKRATTTARELRPEEYRTGMARLTRLVQWLQPKALCFVGLAGWRDAIDRSAQPGVQPTRIGGRPCYVMPSTSGANAHATAENLARHLRAAAALSQRS